MILRLAALGVGAYVATVAVVYRGAVWHYSRKWPAYAPAKRATEQREDGRHDDHQDHQ